MKTSMFHFVGWLPNSKSAVHRGKLPQQMLEIFVHPTDEDKYCQSVKGHRIWERHLGSMCSRGARASKSGSDFVTMLNA